MVGKKDLEQYKRIIRAIAVLIVIVIMVFIFYVIWTKYYNRGIVFPFYSK